MPFDYSRVATVRYPEYDQDHYIVYHWLGVAPFTEPQKRICRWWRVDKMEYYRKALEDRGLDLCPVWYDEDNGVQERLL